MAHRAEGGLWEEGGCELVALDIVDLGLFDGSPALVQGEEAFSLTVSQVLCIWEDRRDVSVHPVLISHSEKMQLPKYFVTEADYSLTVMKILKEITIYETHKSLI